MILVMNRNIKFCYKDDYTYFDIICFEPVEHSCDCIAMWKLLQVAKRLRSTNTSLELNKGTVILHIFLLRLTVLMLQYYDYIYFLKYLS
jgi:hypothetical protein